MNDIFNHGVCNTCFLYWLVKVFAAKKEGATEDNENVYKGLCALAGIYSFFIFGRIQGIYMNRKIKVKTSNYSTTVLKITMMKIEVILDISYDLKC